MLMSVFQNIFWKSWFDIFVNKQENDKVDVSFENDEIIVSLNDQPVAREKVVPYNFFIGFKMVLKDLFYG